MRIYIDESGFTGADLNNADQLAFVLASLHASEDEAQTWKDQFFPGVVSTELKHSSLRRTKSRQDMVVRFLEFIRENRALIKLSAYHKRYALIGKLVDFVIEPAFHWNGIDLYRDGQNIIWTNRIYWGAKTAKGSNVLGNLCRDCQSWLRKRDATTLEQLRSTLTQSRKVKTLNEPLAYALVACEKYGSKLTASIPADALDLAMSAALVLMGRWRAETEEAIELVHDAGKNLSQRRDIWDKLTDDSIEPAMAGYDFRKMKFPVHVASTRFESSIGFAGLQLADVLSGSLAHLIRWHEMGEPDTDEYGPRLLEVFGEMEIDAPMLPFLGFTPEALGAGGEPEGDMLQLIANLTKQ